MFCLSFFSLSALDRSENSQSTSKSNKVTNHWFFLLSFSLKKDFCFRQTRNLCQRQTTTRNSFVLWPFTDLKVRFHFFLFSIFNVSTLSPSTQSVIFLNILRVPFRFILYFHHVFLWKCMDVIDMYLRARVRTFHWSFCSSTVEKTFVKWEKRKFEDKNVLFTLEAVKCTRGRTWRRKTEMWKLKNCYFQMKCVKIKFFFVFYFFLQPNVVFKKTFRMNFHQSKLPVSIHAHVFFCSSAHTQ